VAACAGRSSSCVASAAAALHPGHRRRPRHTSPTPSARRAKRASSRSTSAFPVRHRSRSSHRRPARRRGLRAARGPGGATLAFDAHGRVSLETLPNGGCATLDVDVRPANDEPGWPRSAMVIAADAQMLPTPAWLWRPDVIAGDVQATMHVASRGDESLAVPFSCQAGGGGVDCTLDRTAFSWDGLAAIGRLERRTFNVGWRRDRRGAAAELRAAGVGCDRSVDAVGRPRVERDPRAPTGAARPRDPRDDRLGRARRPGVLRLHDTRAAARRSCS